MIKWGVIGYGNIAKRFIESLSHNENGELYAVATRSGKGIDDLLQRYPHLCYYEDYQQLLDDDCIDAIYIALPHQSHYKWAKQALLKKKAVLCEKPATLSYQQTKELCDLSKQTHTFFMEAMKTRFIPLIQDMKDMIQQETIGIVSRIETSFCNDVNYQEGSYLFDKKQGGILYDCGIYNIEMILDFIDSPLIKINGQYTYQYDVDVYDCIELTFKNQQTALIECAMNQTKEKRITIFGEKGKMIATPFYRPQEVTVILNDGKSYTHTKKYIVDDFYGEIEEVHRCIKEKLYESERMSHSDSLKAIKMIEMIKENMHG